MECFALFAALTSGWFVIFALFSIAAVCIWWELLCVRVGLITMCDLQAHSQIRVVAFCNFNDGGLSVAVARQIISHQVLLKE